MPYCKKCGAELPEYAVFCSKCGVKYPVSAVPSDEEDVSVAPVEQKKSDAAPVIPSEEKPKKSGQSAAGWFKNNSMTLYVILGVITLALIQLSGNMLTLSIGFGITLAVFAIICSIAFLAVAIVKFLLCAHPSEGKKHSTGDAICLALGIIGFFYVLFLAIVVFDTASTLNDLNDIAASLGGL